MDAPRQRSRMRLITGFGDAYCVIRLRRITHCPDAEATPLPLPRHARTRPNSPALRLH